MSDMLSSATVSGLAVGNAMLAQIAPTDAESWLAIASKLGATAVLGLACFVLWKKTEKQAAENMLLREQHLDSLRGVIQSNTQVIQRNTDVLDDLKQQLQIRGKL